MDIDKASKNNSRYIHKIIGLHMCRGIINGIHIAKKNTYIVYICIHTAKKEKKYFLRSKEESIIEF